MNSVRSSLGLTAPVLHPYREEPRMVRCPLCGSHLDAGYFDPMEKMECEKCHATFPVSTRLDDFELIQAYEAGWSQAVYLARQVSAGTQAILKVISSHVISQASAFQNFAREARGWYRLCRPDQVQHVISGQEGGFAWFAVVLKPGIIPEKVLESLKIGGDDDGVIHLEDIPHVESTKSLFPCPQCQAKLDITPYNPLDAVTCHSCKKKFELMRDFGDYQLERRLGEGGTSILYQAYHRPSRTMMALKVLMAAEVLKKTDRGAEFIREMELTRSLIHPNIIRVYDGGEKDGVYFMAMELLDGKTMGDIFALVQEATEEEKGPKEEDSEHSMNRDRFRQALPELICLEIAMEVATGLGYAHSLGIIHGDMKPENIMITSKGDVKILDFGLSQMANVEKRVKEGEARSIHGTPLYIPPERVRGEAENFTSDLYGLGATFYHMLRGIEPFRARTVYEMVTMHANQPMITFKAFAPWVSETTCRIVEKSMRKSTVGRYQSHIEFLADLKLAKSLLVQSMKQKPLHTRSTLRKFMQQLPVPRSEKGLWKKTGAHLIGGLQRISRVWKKGAETRKI